jgi:hypothetical protein
MNRRAARLRPVKYDEKKFSPIFTAHARRWDTVHKRGDLRIEIPYPSAYSSARGVSPVTRVTTIFRETPARACAHVYMNIR